MLRKWILVLLSTVVVGATAPASAEDAAVGDEPRAMLAIDIVVQPEARTLVSASDVSQYETYLRTLFRELAPGLPMATDARSERAASPVFRVEFTAGDPGTLHIVVTMEVGHPTSRWVDLSGSTSFTVAAGDRAAAEGFLRRQVRRIVELYGFHRLHGGAAPTTTISPSSNETSAEVIAALIPLVPLPGPTPKSAAVPTPTSAPGVPAPTSGENRQQSATTVPATPNAAAIPVAQASPSTTPPRSPQLRQASAGRAWLRPWRIAALSGAGAGLAAISIGAWQGVAAKRSESDYGGAVMQLEAADAKRRSEVAGERANAWLGVGGGITMIAVGVLTLDLFGLIGDRPSEQATPSSSVSVGATSNALVVGGIFSLP